MRTVVFIGPSLPTDLATCIVDAEFMPPAAQGDLLKALRAKPQLVLIIDGYFEDTPAIWHNEIIEAMEGGATVLGAASIGALRAAELYRYGMIGVGVIYQAFRKGWLEDDDEVAVVCAPPGLGSTALTEAMVNVRATLRAASRGGVISAEQAGAVLALAKSLFYKDRSWPRILSAAREDLLIRPVAGRLSRWVELNRVDQKRTDAVAALRRVRLYQQSGPPARRGEPIRVEPTAAWLRLLESMEPAPPIPRAAPAPGPPTW